MNTLKSALAGCLVGTAVGDALGLPAEGLSRTRQRQMFGEITGYRFLGGSGMVSDDTEHTVLVAQALVASAGNPDHFETALVRGLKRWVLLLPAGIGMATLRACLRLLFGFPPSHSGVFSAGNGPAMRSALLGVCCGHSPQQLKALVQRSSRLTHTDPKAEFGARVIALAAYLSAQGTLTPDHFSSRLPAILPEPCAGELLSLLHPALRSAEAGEDSPEFAVRTGLVDGVSGYMYHTVPVVVQTVLRYPREYRAAVLRVIACGGDTDTTAALVGGIVGAGVGVAGIPQDWRDNLKDWSYPISGLTALGERLSRVCETQQPGEFPLRPLAIRIPRNVLFALVVLLHGLRRLFPF